MRKRLRKKLRRRHWFDFRLSASQAAEKVMLDKYGFRSMAKLQAAFAAGKFSISAAGAEDWFFADRIGAEVAGTSIAIDIDRQILADLAKIDKG